MLARFLLRWIFNSIALYVTTAIGIGISVPDPADILIAALALGLVNATLRWVFLVLTLPINILTLGLFTLVVNAMMLYVVAALTPLQIASPWAAFWGALLIAVISTGLSRLASR